jgi:hypothetical protein
MMNAADRLLQFKPYELAHEDKLSVFLPALQETFQHHYERCELFRRWCGKRHFSPDSRIGSVSDYPFMPAGIFKKFSLQSCGDAEIVRIVKSSATSSQHPSRVVLDQITRDRQIKALAQTIVDLLGPARRPFVVLDCAPSEDRTSLDLSARIAGLRGYLMAANQIHYALTKDETHPTLDVRQFEKKLDEIAASGKAFCMIGYTYMLYQHVLRPLREAGVRWKLPADTFLLHFGGWKRLQDQAVSKTELLSTAEEVFGLGVSAVRDIYGFTEQLGVIYPDDSNGIKRVPVYSEVVVRNPRTLKANPDGEAGLLEFVTPLMHSYPGMALLTDDIGRIVTRESTDSTRFGTGFEVVGRAANVEVRGCGDTLPSHVYQMI